MNMIIKLGTLAAIAIILSVGGCGAGGLWGDDQFSKYTQRTDAITPDGGNAKDVNAITHMYHPWPPGIYDRQVVTDSPRMQRALDRYRKDQRPYDPLPDIGIGSSPIGQGQTPPPEPLPQRPTTQPPPGAAYGNGQ
jgi:hypothetical protein